MPKRMRDLRGRLAAAGLALALLAGCAAGQQPASTAAPSPAAPNAQTPEAAAAASFGEMEQATPGLRAMGQDGMYLLEQYFSGAMNLLYADFTTQQEVFVCAEPNCPHNTASCTSWLPFAGDYTFPALAALKGQLYLVLGASTEEQRPYISELSADGREQRRLAELEANEMIQSDLFADDKSLYCAVVRVEEDSASQLLLLRIDRQTGSQTWLYTFPEGTTYSLDGVAGGKIAVVRYPAPNDPAGSFDHWLLDPNADIAAQLAQPPLFSTDNVTRKGQVYRGVLSLADLPAGTCTLTELETGKETVFSVNAETLDLPEEPTDFFCSLETPGIAMLQVTCPGQTYRFVYDPDQGGFVPFTLARQSDYTDGAVVPFGTWQDMLVLYIGDQAVRPPDPDLAAPEAPEVIVSQYALLPTGDFLRSEPNYQLIRLP